jgi:ASC-1-like (ASCH) protein
MSTGISFAVNINDQLETYYKKYFKYLTDNILFVSVWGDYMTYEIKELKNPDNIKLFVNLDTILSELKSKNETSYKYIEKDINSILDKYKNENTTNNFSQIIFTDLKSRNTGGITVKSKSYDLTQKLIPLIYIYYTQSNILYMLTRIEMKLDEKIKTENIRISNNLLNNYFLFLETFHLVCNYVKLKKNVIIENTKIIDLDDIYENFKNLYKTVPQWIQYHMIELEEANANTLENFNIFQFEVGYSEKNEIYYIKAKNEDIAKIMLITFILIERPKIRAKFDENLIEKNSCTPLDKPKLPEVKNNVNEENIMNIDANENKLNEKEIHELSNILSGISETRKNLTRKHINMKYFWQVFHKEKKIEARLNRGFWEYLDHGDFVFYTFDEKKDLYLEFSVKVVGSRTYNSFEDLLIFEGIRNVLPKVKSLDEAINIYSEIYDDSGEIENDGIIGIELEVTGTVLTYKYSEMKEKFKLK